MPSYGIESFLFPAGVDFDPYASFTWRQTTTQGSLYKLLNAWAGAYFHNYTGGSTPTVSAQGLTIGSTTSGYGWAFYYNLPTNAGYVAGDGTWADTDHGTTTGNIVG